MRILIDECLDWRLGHALTGHDYIPVQKMGWGVIKNGKLLALPSASYFQRQEKSNREALLLTQIFMRKNKLRNLSL
jgi:hypothetical protein